MPRLNPPLIAFNRGLIDPTAEARTDLDRTKMSASKMTNWLPKTQGAMTIRPGTKYLGSSLNDTGAEFIEFVAATDETALLEFTNGNMRIWDNDALLARVPVTATVTLSDTGWANVSTGGEYVESGGTDITTDEIPSMTAATTGGVTISTSSDNDDGAFGGRGWNIADDDNSTRWSDTGQSNPSTLPSWINVDFGSGNAKTITSYSMRAADQAINLKHMAQSWRVIGSNYDTGTYAIDTGKWYLEDERTTETAWSVAEKRTYTMTDTGTADAWRHWRVYVTGTNSNSHVRIYEMEMFQAAGGATNSGQVAFASGTLTLNATALGSVAKAEKCVVMTDTGQYGTEHALYIRVTRGPVIFRVGSTSGEEDLVAETLLGTGYHNIAFTPYSNFYVQFQNDQIIDRTVGECRISDTGQVVLTSPFNASQINNLRYDQSADVVFIACSDRTVRPRRLERRGTGRSWSIVEYAPDFGPMFNFRSSGAHLHIGQTYGNTTMTSDIPAFRPEHEGALMRIFHEGQGGTWILGNSDAVTSGIQVVGIGDTGKGRTANGERRISFDVSGTYAGEITIERSVDGPDIGFTGTKEVADPSDTGTFTLTIADEDDNLVVWYRAKMTAWTSGAAKVKVTYPSGGVTGIARIVKYNTNKSVDIEVLRQFSDTGRSDNWQEGQWSGVWGYPTAPALHEGRLFWAGQANIWGSESDNYEGFDDELLGDASPIDRTFGSGPVDGVYSMISLLRLVAVTAGSEIAIRASSIDEILTPDNASAKAFSTQGGYDIRMLKLDSRGIFVQRSGQKVYLIDFAQNVIGDYNSQELSILVPKLLAPGVVSIAVQRQPDTRIHCVLADGTVAIMTYEPNEEVLAWSLWKSDTGTASAVERVAVLPGVGEDQVYYHVRRTINGVTKRYLEKWAKESEAQGDTGLSWLVDCAVSYTDTGAATSIVDFAPHLGGQTIAAWANDTGQNNSYGKDLTPDDTGNDSVLLSVDTGGDLTLSDSGWKHVVGGLQYFADYRSSKMAYGSQMGTALTQAKRIDKVGLVLAETHNRGLYFGDDTGSLDPMPRISDEGAQVDADKIFETFDQISIPLDGTWGSDSRVYLRGKSPRPVTVLGAIPGMREEDR